MIDAAKSPPAPLAPLERGSMLYMAIPGFHEVQLQARQRPYCTCIAQRQLFTLEEKNLFLDWIVPTL